MFIKETRLKKQKKIKLANLHNPIAPFGLKITFDL